MNITEKNLKDTLQFCDEMAEQKLEIINDLFEFSCEFNEKYDEVMPFHLLLMEFVLNSPRRKDNRIYEIYHSRLLHKMLSYKKGDTYPILESFCKDLLKFGLKVNKPVIVREASNIDILVQDTDYCLIIENKKNNAEDKPNQLARYINSANEKMKNLNRVYICYLPNNRKNPEEHSWENPVDGTSYKKEFVSRFQIVPFRDEILEWLEKLEINDHNIYLQTALKQYAYLIKENA
jgi:hypothetical protein